MQRFFYIIFCLFFCAHAAFAAQISAVYAEISDKSDNQETESNETVLTISGRDFDENNISIFQIKKDNPRIVIDCRNCPLPDIGRVVHDYQREIKGQGLVKRIRMARRENNVTRLVLDLYKTPDSLEKKIKSKQITIQLFANLPLQNIHKNTSVADSKTAEVVKAISVSRSQTERNELSYDGTIPVPRLKRAHQTQGHKTYKASTSIYVAEIAGIPIPRLKPGYVIRRKPIIVIDPGHGGHDPGAIGSLDTQEKQITLETALELKKMLVKSGRYKVILTRKDDRYITHDMRLRIARAGGADLFISLHADSASPTARGVSVYTLADRSIDRSKNIVDSQNWIMDVDLTQQSDPVGDILVDLAQRKTFSHSEQFANQLISHLKPKTLMVGNTHRRAGYFVLLAPDVPAVLLELGFISNQDDEKLLNSKRHRRKIMSAVTTAINAYFDTQKR